jgi:tetratricopeptide (TPR) repeat protein
MGRVETVNMEDFIQLRSKIEELFHSNIQAAVDLVLSLPENDPNISQLKASTLVDGGHQLKSEQLIKQGIDIFENLLSIDKIKPITLYNLANGLSALTSLKWGRYGNEWKTQYKWYFDTIKERLLAKHNYSTAIAGQTDSKQIAQAFNNRANMLNSAFRWIEAIREYSYALKNDSKNGVAAGGIIKQIMGGYRKTAVNKNWLPVLVPPLYKSIIVNKEYSAQLCGENEFNKMMTLFDKWNIQNIPLKDLKTKRKRLTSYQSFVFSNELYLSPFMTRELFVPDLCDSLQIRSFISKDKLKSSEVPSVFGMFNTIKADYLTVRWLAFTYFDASLPKNSFYHDTLDYAVYGTKPSLLTITQRLAFDILDKIAVAVLTSVGDPRAEDPFMSFRRAWFKFSTKDKVPENYFPTIEIEIEKGNRALIALSELAFDIYDYYKDGCSYQKKKHKLRNSSTHRFTILHDMGFNKYYSQGSIDHYAIEDIEKELIDTLYIIKAAIIYFIEVIYFRNGMLDDELGGKFANLNVPSHKRIRGEKS